MPNDKWDLSRLSPGERSVLKRSAGIMMGSNMKSVQAFYHALVKPCPKMAEDAWYAAMCLECLWRPEDHPRVMKAEEMISRLYQKDDTTESVKKRCTAFMDLNWSEDGFLLGKLSALFRMMCSADGSVMPDFEALADDLCKWNHADHYVQRRWMRTICMPHFEQNDHHEEEKENVD